MQTDCSACYNQSMWNILSEFFLVCHFSLVFSLTLLCTVFLLRTRDKIVLRLLYILYPLFLYSLAALFYYLFSDELKQLMETVSSAVSLFLLMLTSLTVPLIIYGTSSYMLSLLDLPDKNRRIGRLLITVFSLIIFVFGLYFIIFLNSSDWNSGLSSALNELFLCGSFFQFLVVIAAAVFLPKTKDKRNKQLLRGIVISFAPVGALVVLDLIFFLGSPYKLVYICYSIFAVLVYLYTSRYYVHRYDPESSELPSSVSEFYRKAEISEREQQLIPYLIEGKSNKEISELLFISTNTVKTHVRNIYRKAGVSNRLQLMSKIRSHP